MPSHRSELPAPTFPPAPLGPGKVVLITGGLGTVGLTIASVCARAGCRLVLTARTPERRLAAVRALEAQGAEVLVGAADAADADAMARVIAEAKARFGAIQVVIHGAGTTAPETFRAVQEVERADFAQHFRPKVHGLLVLRELLADEPIELAMVLSSASTVLGGLGFVAYAGANAFMDAFVRAERRRGVLAWMSVDWSDWQTSAGALAGTEMTLEEGAGAFERALTARELPQLVHSTIDLGGRLAQWLAPATAPEPAGRPRHERPNLPTPYVAPRNDVEQRIAAIWESLLGIERVGIHDKFLALGGNSLLGTQLVARLREAFAVNLPLRSLFTAQTVADLAVLVEEAVLAEVEALPEGEVEHAR